MRKDLYDKFLNFDRFRASVKYEMTLRNWTYSTLSHRTGYSVHYITNLMHGNGSRTATLRIARELGIDPKEFK